MPTINELCAKYGVTRSTLYSWINAGKLETTKDGLKTVISEDQLWIIDDVRAWIEKDNPLKNYVPTTQMSTVDVMSYTSEPEPLEESTELITPVDNQQLALYLSVAERLIENFLSPIRHWDELERAVQNNYLISTKEIATLVGTKPQGNVWERGSYRFTYFDTPRPKGAGILGS